MYPSSSKDIHFPQELIDLCTDHLAAKSTIESISVSDDLDNGNLKALLQCLLVVSRSFYPRARYHLFSDTIIENRTKFSQRFSSFRALLEEASPSFPSLATCITSIWMVQGYNGVSEDPLESGDITAIMQKLHGPGFSITKFSLALSGLPWTVYDPTSRTRCMASAILRA